MTTPVALRKLAKALRDSTGLNPGERSDVMHSVATSLEAMARRGKPSSYDPTTQPYDAPYGCVPDDEPIPTRFIPCEFCEAEGRVKRSNDDPDDADGGICPSCNGAREIEIECEPITIWDIENAEWY